VPRIDLIQLRKQTAANWTLANPILELIEPGVETDTDLMKFGNGTSNWNDLPYATHKHTNASVLAKITESGGLPLWDGGAWPGSSTQIQTDWNATTGLGVLLNKPTIPAAATDANITITDITTNNVSTTQHGFFPKLPTATGKYLKDDLTWDAPTATGGGLTSSAISTATNAVANYRYICDTSTAAFTLTLPATPAAGDYIEIVDAKGSFATNNLTVANNTKNINGVAEALIIDMANAFITLTFSNDTTRGWQVDVGGNGFPKFSTSTVYSNLVEEKILTVDSSSVTFSGLDSLVDGDYYLDATLIGTTGAVATDCEMYVNAYTVATDYRQIWSAGQVNAPIIGSIQGNYGTLINAKISVINGYAMIIGSTGRQNAATTLTNTTFTIQYTAATVTKISALVLRLVGNVSYIKAGSTFRLYKSNGAKYLVPYNPTDITSRTSDYPLKAGETVYRTYTNATSVPLYIATQEGEYEIIITGPVMTPGVITGSNYFVPNNNFTTFNVSYASYSGDMWTGSNNVAAGNNVLYGMTTGIGVGNGYIAKAVLKVSTYTTGKSYQIDAMCRWNNAQVITSVTQSKGIILDTTTVWSSLGTLNLALSQSGKIIIKRIL
jgi:hypothetical protein